MNWVTQNIGTIITVLLGGGGLAAAVKSFRWARPYERVLVTGPRGVVFDKATNKPKEYTGFVFRPLGFYRMTIVNIRSQFQNIVIEGVMRISEDADPHREKWKLSGTLECHVDKGHVYDACEWEVSDLGEHIRGTAQNAIKDYLQAKPVTLDLETTKDIFEVCEGDAHEAMLKHGVIWDKLMINEFALADAEIQGQAIRKIAKAIEKSVAVFLGSNFNDGQITTAVESWVSSLLSRDQSVDVTPPSS